MGAPPPPSPGLSRRGAMWTLLGACALALLLSAQTVSLASGMTIVWLGVVLSCLTLGVALTWRVVGRGMIITCVVVAAVCVASAIYDAHFINEQRHKIIEQLTP